VGETFECSGGSTSQCLQTGNDVLELMSFSKQDLRQSVLGLAIMFLFFLFSAIGLLELDRLKFMKLGHVGSKQRNRVDSATTTSRDDYVAVPPVEHLDAIEN
jgi:hypothetical protein